METINFKELIYAADMVVFGNTEETLPENVPILIKYFAD